MNSTAILRTERAGAPVAPTADALRLALTVAVLALITITLRPFGAGGVSEGGESSFANSGMLINQLGYSVMTAAVLFAVLTLVDRRVLVAAVSAGWLAMAGIVALSAFTSVADGAWRSVLFSLMAAGIASSVAVLPATARDFETALKTVSLALLALCYGGLVLDPMSAMHQPFDLESQHAGLWRGVFFHKNIAGPVMMMIGFGGIFLMRRGHWMGGGIVALLAFVFAINAGSKTALALAPLVVVLILVPAMFGLRLLAAIAAVTAIAGAHALTVGTAFVPAFDAVLRSFSETTTFTGRTAIWDFAGDYLLAHPWTGFGFDGFWGTPLLLATEQPFDRSWDPRGIVHGHNGFFDVMLFFGLPGLVLSVWLFVLAPAIDYVRAGGRQGGGPLADFFFMVVVFAVLTASLESFFFRRADPIWLIMVVALAGLRLGARLSPRAGP